MAMLPLIGTEFLGQSEYVSDLGVTIDKHLGFTEHIAKNCLQGTSACQPNSSMFHVKK